MTTSIIDLTEEKALVHAGVRAGITPETIPEEHLGDPNNLSNTGTGALVFRSESKRMITLSFPLVVAPERLLFVPPGETQGDLPADEVQASIRTHLAELLGREAEAGVSLQADKFGVKAKELPPFQVTSYVDNYVREFLSEVRKNRKYLLGGEPFHANGICCDSSGQENARRCLSLIDTIFGTCVVEGGLESGRPSEEEFLELFFPMLYDGAPQLHPKEETAQLWGMLLLFSDLFYPNIAVGRPSEPASS